VPAGEDGADDGERRILLADDPAAHFLEDELYARFKAPRGDQVSVVHGSSMRLMLDSTIA
jgi:hypothetical protein